MCRLAQKSEPERRPVCRLQGKRRCQPEQGSSSRGSGDEKRKKNNLQPFNSPKPGPGTSCPDEGGFYPDSIYLPRCVLLTLGDALFSPPVERSPRRSDPAFCSSPAACQSALWEPATQPGFESVPRSFQVRRPHSFTSPFMSEIWCHHGN